MIKIFVVDDHNLFRVMMKAAFNAGYPDIYMAGEAENGKELFRQLTYTDVDLVLLDINLPDIWGVEVTRRLRREYPHIKIIAVSGENSTETIHEMIDAGINGFLSKQRSDPDELARAIREVMNDMTYYGRDVLSIMYDVYATKKKTSTLTEEFTDREREILLLSRDGLQYKEIADRLGISASTVNTHKQHIFQKLGINSTTEMVQYALKHKIIKIEN